MYVYITRLAQNSCFHLVMELHIMPTHFSLISVLGVRWEKQETCIYLGFVKQSLSHRVISQAFLTKPVIWCCPIKLGFSCCFSISINNSQNFCSPSFGGIKIIKVWSSGRHQRGEGRSWSSMGCGINKIKQNFVLLSFWHSRYERNTKQVWPVCSILFSTAKTDKTISIYSLQVSQRVEYPL